MTNIKEKLSSYSIWRSKVISTIIEYKEWREKNNLSDSSTEEIINSLLNNLKNDKITLAFAAEFSRGKTELINSLFFAEHGERLLPSSSGRTTMCPTEIYYDLEKGAYLKLLPIESKLGGTSISEHKENLDNWTTFELNLDSPSKMKNILSEISRTKKVSKVEAEKLGLYNENLENETSLLVSIPYWRHALISYPNPLLKNGLSILDTPGLNALGSEPELTINMLPSAQAIIFILAADTGVTKSDFSLWNDFIKEKTNKIAVVMNKIDVLWDDINCSDQYEKDITEQIKSISKTLNITTNSIFPVSAKQALVGKIKKNNELIDRSGVSGLESFLSEDIIFNRKEILKNKIKESLGFLVSESLVISENNLENNIRELEDFNKIDIENKELTGRLFAETKDRHKAYLLNVENFQGSRRVFSVQSKMLLDSLSREKIDDITLSIRNSMNQTFTTYGMLKEMGHLIDELKLILEEAIEITKETKMLINAIHKKFVDDYGFKKIEPKSFSIDNYKRDLDKILLACEEFKGKPSTSLKEQSVVVDLFYKTLISQAKHVLRDAHKEAKGWSNSVLIPLMHQIKDHKKQIESRVKMMKQIESSKINVGKAITEIEENKLISEESISQLLKITKKFNFEEGL